MKTGITTAVAALALGLAATAPLRAAPYTVTEVMSGLVTPRGLAFAGLAQREIDVHGIVFDEQDADGSAHAGSFAASRVK